MAKRWSDEEETKLRELVGDGLSVAEIADRLGRSPSSVAIRINGSGETAQAAEPASEPASESEVTAAVHAAMKRRKPKRAVAAKPVAAERMRAAAVAVPVSSGAFAVERKTCATWNGVRIELTGDAEVRELGAGKIGLRILGHASEIEISRV